MEEEITNKRTEDGIRNGQSSQYEMPVYCDADFPVVFHEDRMDDKRPCVYANWHSGIEVLWCRKGSGFLLSNAERVPFRQDDLVVINSGALHSLEIENEECVYYCLIVEPALLMRSGLPVMRRLHSVIRDAELSRLFESIVDEMNRSVLLYKSMVIGYILLLFTGLYRQYAQNSSADLSRFSQHAYEGLSQALEYIRAHMAEAISIDAVCHEVGMSRYYFCHMFKLYTGMPPLQYINMIKCDEARRLMIDSGLTVQEAASAVGIDNPSYFTKMYKRHMGVTPSDDTFRRDPRDRNGDVMGIRRQ